MRNTPVSAPPYRTLAAFATAWALPTALFFLLLELLKTYRDSQWGGTDPADWAGVVLGGAIYAAVLTVAGTLIAALLRLMFRRLAHPEWVAPAAGLAAALGLWTLLSQYREHTPTLDDALVAAALAALCLGWVALRLLRGLSFFEYIALAGAVLLAGLAALAGAGEVFLFSGHRADVLTQAPAAYGVQAAGLALLAWWPRGALRWVLRPAVACALAALPLVAAHALTHAPARAGEEHRPNLLFIISDALRADCLDLYGGPVPAPNLARLAEDGARFEQSYSLAPWTMPSMAAMFGSDYPKSLAPNVDGEVWLSQIWRYRVRPGNQHLAATLRARGYATGAATANALLWALPGLLEGFDGDARAHPILLARSGPLNHCPFLHDALTHLMPGFEGLRPHDTTKDLEHYAQSWLKRHRNQPFFLYVHYIDPHAPSDPPPRFRPKENGPWPFFYPYAGGERWGIPQLGPDFSIPPAHRPYVRALYEGEVRQVDASVGELVRLLERLGLRDSTYICFSADHGEEHWDHGQWGHGQSVYDELVRVPLLFSGPGIPHAVFNAPVSGLDLMPTFAGLLNIQPDPAWKGVDLAPALHGQAPPPPARPLFAQGTSNKAYPHPYRMVLSNGWKLIEEVGSETYFLHNLREDPGEQHDRLAGAPARAAELRQVLDAWLDSFDHTFDVEPSGDTGEMAPRLMEQLRGMGYL